jgi:hypothetical protein
MTGGAHPTSADLAASKRSGPGWTLPASHAPPPPKTVSAAEQEEEEEEAEFRFRSSPEPSYRYSRGFKVCTSRLGETYVVMTLASAQEQAWVSVTVKNGTRGDLTVSPDAVSLKIDRGYDRLEVSRLSVDQLASAYTSSWWLDYLEERALTMQSFSVKSNASVGAYAYGSDGWGYASASGQSSSSGIVEGSATDKIAAREYIDARRERQRASRDAMMESLLWRTTLAPEEAVSGQVAFRLPRNQTSESYRASVKIDDVTFACDLEPRQ